MLGLRRGLKGVKRADERAIHREISGKESEGAARRGGSGDVCTSVSVRKHVQEESVCVVKNIQPPTSWICKRGIIE